MLAPFPRRLLVGVLSVVSLFAILGVRSSGQTAVTTYHNDNLRTGENLLETTLTLTNVNSKQFGKLFSQTVDGYIYAQPLYVPAVALKSLGTHNVVFVATMNDSIYAFDADNKTGSNAQPLWKVSFINPAKGITTLSETDVNCPDFITTKIGVAGTPVIDTSTGTLYVIARTKESGQFFQRLHALDITSGAEKFGGPVVIQASAAGSGTGSSNGLISFSPQLENQRSALLFQNGLVYVAWGSLCDTGAYHGWLMAYDHMSLQQEGVWLVTPNGDEGAIWNSGSGPAGDASFNTFVATANGTFDAESAGKDYAQSIVKLAPPANATFSVLDYFTPYNGPSLDKGDYDIGSGGLMLLPDQLTGPHTHLLVQSGKVGDIYLVNRDSMGHYNSQNNNQIVQYLPAAEKGMWNSPAWWNGNVYFGASGDYLKAFSLSATTGLLSVTPASETSKTFAYPGTTPSISANQNSNAILWTLNNGTYKKTTGNAVLHAYNATDLATELYNSSQNATRDSPGPAVKFTVPTVVNGKVYVGTQTKLSVFGLLAASSKSSRPAARATGPQ